jgi:hypothetical protein
VSEIDNYQKRKLEAETIAQETAKACTSLAVQPANGLSLETVRFLNEVIRGSDFAELVAETLKGDVERARLRAVKEAQQFLRGEP